MNFASRLHKVLDVSQRQHVCAIIKHTQAVCQNKSSMESGAQLGEPSSGCSNDQYSKTTSAAISTGKRDTGKKNPKTLALVSRHYPGLGNSPMV